MKPLQTGVALSVTVGLFYSICTLIEALWPSQFVGFMNALFHGLDFRVLLAVPAHPWRDYLYALVVLMVWAFAVGAFFASLHSALGRAQLGRRIRHA